MKGKKRAVLVGHDLSPSGAFNLLALALQQAGMRVRTFLDYGKPFDFQIQEITKSVITAHFLVAGMSSSEQLAATEIAACQAAVTNNVPFGFYGDTYGAYHRAAKGSWFDPFRQRASFYFALNDAEAKRARRVFPKAQCLATGNPLWEAFSFPKYSHQQVREQLGIGFDEVFILVPFVKSPVLNILIYGTLLDALGCLSPKAFTVILAYHPGDRTPYAIDPGVVERLGEKVVGSLNSSFSFDLPAAQLNIYNHLIEHAPPNVSIRQLNSSYKTSDVLPGAELVVEFASSICLEAAHLRIPVISVVSAVGANRLYSLTGSRVWEPIKLGASQGSGSNPVQLANLIRKLLFNPDFQKKLRQRQEEVYPVAPEKGTAVNKMVELLLTL